MEIFSGQRRKIHLISLLWGKRKKKPLSPMHFIQVLCLSKFLLLDLLLGNNYLMLKLKLQYFGHLMRRTDSFEKTLMLGKIEAGGKEDDRGWDGWMASPTQWTWVWVNSWSWWWTERPDVLRFMGSQRVRHDWATELTELNICPPWGNLLCKFLNRLSYQAILFSKLIWLLFCFIYPLRNCYSWVHFPENNCSG